MEVITDAEVTAPLGTDTLESVEIAAKDGVAVTRPTQPVIGSGEAATAVNDAPCSVLPEEQMFPGHSSDSLPAAV